MDMVFESMLPILLSVKADLAKLRVVRSELEPMLDDKEPLKHMDWAIAELESAVGDMRAAMGE